MFKIYDGRQQFYQWDIGRKIIVDVDVSQVHFTNLALKTSLVSETYIENGLTVANVPNILLQKDLRIDVYAYDKNYTKYGKQFEVISRAKPDDYVYTETEILNYNSLLERINKIDENIGEAVEDYIEENPIEVDLSDYYTIQQVDNIISTIELTPGPKGDAGPKGDKGEPGYTPVKGVDYFDGKDGLNGKDGAQGKDGIDGKDGYTPIKGVDYFDGIQGEQGPKGDKGDQGIQGEQGPAGKDGIDGKDYILTDADKQEIADMVDVSGADVDLSDYYTKEEIDNMLSNLPTGDIPSGEGVEF